MSALWLSGCSLQKSFLIILLLLASTLITPESNAELSGSVGAGSCDTVARLLASNGWDVKNVMLAGEIKKRKPRTGDFKCISPRYTRGMSQITIPAMRNEVFVLPQNNIQPFVVMHVCRVVRRFSRAG